MVLISCNAEKSVAVLYFSLIGTVVVVVVVVVWTVFASFPGCALARTSRISQASGPVPVQGPLL